MKKYFIFVSIIIVLILALSGCSSTGEKSEDEIIDDLNSDVEKYFFNYDNTSVQGITIDKRLTDAENREDTINATLLLDISGSKTECKCIINYLLYNEGWEIDSIEIDKNTVIPKEAPEKLANQYVSDLIENNELGSGDIDAELKNVNFDDEHFTASFTYDITRECETAKFVSNLDLTYSFDKYNMMWLYMQWTNYNIEAEISDDIKEEANQDFSQYASESGYDFTFGNYEYDKEEDQFIFHYECTKDNGNFITTASGKQYVINDYLDGEYTVGAEEIHISNIELKDLTGEYVYEREDDEPITLTIDSCENENIVFSFYCDKYRYSEVSANLEKEGEFFYGAFWEENNVIVPSGYVYVYEDEILVTESLSFPRFSCPFTTKYELQGVQGKEKVLIPDITCQTKEDGIDYLSDIGLFANVVEEESSEVAPGRVVRTDPELNEEVFIGSTVTIFVSKGETDD